MSILSAENTSSVQSGDTEDFWNRKKESLQSLKKTIRNGKRNLLGNRATPATIGNRRLPSNRTGNLETIHEPRVIDHTNYRNYLRRRFPHITGAEASSSIQADDNAKQGQKRILQVDDAELSEFAAVVRPVQSPPAPATSKLGGGMLDAYIYLCDNRLFAHDFTSTFINQHLDEDEIPDMLMEVLAELSAPPAPPLARRVWSRSPKSPLLPLAKSTRDSPFLHVEHDDSDAVADILGRVGYRGGAHSHRLKKPPQVTTVMTPSPPPGFAPVDAASFDALQQLLRSLLPDLLWEVATQAVAEETNVVLAGIGVADMIAPHLLDETIAEMTTEVASQAVKQLAAHEIAKGLHYDVFLELVNELIQEVGPAIARRAVGEDFLESVLDELVDPVVDNMALEVATDVLEELDIRMRRRELREIRRTAKQKPLEALLFQQLIEKVAQGESLLITSRTLHHFLEATEIDILLKELQQVAQARRMTLECWPIRGLHQRLFTNAAVGVITDELIVQTDADLADLDFDEVTDARQRRFIHDVSDVYDADSAQ